MFIGHFAPALVAAAQPRQAGLGTLFVAAQLVDIGFATLLLTGGEAMRIVPGFTAMNPMDLYHMPYTHSLLGASLFALLFGAGVLALTRRRAAALGAALVVVSHWFIDWLVHVPDLTLAGAPPKLGLGLWNHPAAAITLELGLIGAAFAYYGVRTRGGAAWRLWALAAVLLAVQLFNWFGPQEQSYSISVPLTMLAAYAALAAIASWAGARRTPDPRGIP